MKRKVDKRVVEHDSDLRGIIEYYRNSCNFRLVCRHNPKY